jgi:hypothetical protein
MRVNVLLMVVILFVSSIAAMAATPEVPNSRSDRAVGNVEAPDSAKDLPTVARNQNRPPRGVHSLDCADPTDPGCVENPDPDGGGYTQGGCNCSRICYDGHSSCNLSVASNGCKAGAYYPAECKSCSISGACGW